MVYSIFSKPVSVCACACVCVITRGCEDFTISAWAKLAIPFLGFLFLCFSLQCYIISAYTCKAPLCICM